MRATRFAEELWPDLPWRNSLCNRARLFIEAVDALSQNHGFWIREPVPGQVPLLAIGGSGGENGYTLTPTDDAGTFSLHRSFE